MVHTLNTSPLPWISPIRRLSVANAGRAKFEITRQEATKDANIGFKISDGTSLEAIFLVSSGWCDEASAINFRSPTYEHFWNEGAKALAQDVASASTNKLRNALMIVLSSVSRECFNSNLRKCKLNRNRFDIRTYVTETKIFIHYDTSYWPVTWRVLLKKSRLFWDGEWLASSTLIF